MHGMGGPWSQGSRRDERPRSRGRGSSAPPAEKKKEEPPIDYDDL